MLLRSGKVRKAEVMRCESGVRQLQLAQPAWADLLHDQLQTQGNGLGLGIVSGARVGI